MKSTESKNSTKAATSQAGDATRRRLIDAGIDVFGRYGFEAATTRMLARAAGVNLAAIPYHFGGKEGLYHAAVLQVVDRALGALEAERRIVFETMKNPDASRDELLGALETIIRGFGRVMICSEIGGQFGPIIVREQFHPTSAFDRIYESEMRTLHEAVTCLVARLTGVSPESEEAILRAHAIIGQVVVFRVMRETALRRLEWNGFDEENTRKVCDILIENIRRIFERGNERGL